MGAQGERIGGGYIDVTADLSSFDAAMNALPKKAASRMDEAMKSLKAEMARAKLDLKVAIPKAALTGNTAPVVALTGLQDRLKDKIEAVTAAATRQAQALQAAARAQIASSLVPVGPTDAQAAAMGAGGRQTGGGRNGAGGMSGAMGLMVFSQTLDDIRYGFSAIVNQMPQIGMAIAGALGKGYDVGLKLGSILGVVGVAVNYAINHWSEWMEKIGLATPKIEEVGRGIEGLEAKIKALEEKPIKLAVDMRELDEAKKRLEEMRKDKEAFDAAGQGRTTSEKEAGEKAQQRFGEAGVEGKRARDEVRSQIYGELTAKDPTIGDVAKQQARAEADVKSAEARLARATSQGEAMQAGLAKEAAAKRVEEAKEAARKARVAIEAEADRLTGNLFRGTFAGNDAGAREELVKRLNAAGRPQLAAGIAATPEQVQAEKLNAQGMEVQAEMHEKDRQLGRDLTAQGQAAQDEHFEKLAQQRQAEADRLAGPLSRTVGQSMLENPGMDQDMVRDRVKEALKKAGVAAEDIGKLAPMIAQKLKKQVDEEVQGRVASGQAKNEQDAYKQMLKDEKDRDKSDREKYGGKAEVTSEKSYLDRLLVAGLNRGDTKDVPKQTLDEAKATNKKLDSLIDVVKTQDKKTNHPATFAPGRTR
jgi:hypothetical protein